MTKQFLHETAAYLATAIPSGMSAQTTHPASAVLNDYVTPVEMLDSVEINETCVGMSQAQRNELVKELLDRYEDNLDNAPVGRKYRICCYIHTGSPWQDIL